MHSLSRRTFLGVSIAGLACGRLVAEEPVAKKTSSPSKPLLKPEVDENFVYQPGVPFLTWQRDPTTTMTVQWLDADTKQTDLQVHYAIDEAGPWESQRVTVKPYPMSDLKVFRSELTKLSPGTDYHFRLGDRSKAYRFRTMPAKATSPIHFISGGDCGVNQHTVANNQQAARQDPMFAVIGGDLGYDNGRSVATSLAFLQNYSQQMIARNDRLIPLVPCMGNHEANGGYGQPREQAPFFYALFDGLYPETGFASLDFGDYLSLVLLDTNHTSPIEGEQTEWLEKTLRERVDHPHVMVVNHVPAYPSYRSAKPAAEEANQKMSAGEGNRKHWVPLFEKYRVPVVLEHHDHTFKRTKPLLDGLADERGVLYLGDGSWGRIRTPNPPEKLAYLAKCSRDYHLSLHSVQGDERFHLALDEQGRVMDVCRSGQRTTGAVSLSD